MTYEEAVAWLNSFINLERSTDPGRWSHIKLERVERLMDCLGRPQHHGRCLHIAGTKGKGSTAALAEAMFRSSGYRTGLFTKPHLVSMRERIRINGVPLGRGEFARLVGTRLKPAVGALEPHADEGTLTWFDLHTALAFCCFEEADVDWTVIEVGLGGRLDATNVVAPELTAVTTISLDHTALLGDTLAAVAGEKAGIIKAGVPVVLGPQPPEAAQVLETVAAEREAPVLRAEGVEEVDGGAWLELPDGRVGQRVAVRWPGGGAETVDLPLAGSHQVENAAVARTLAVAAAGRCASRVTLGTVAQGLAAVRWRGRLDVVGREPWVILDGAHNPASAARLREALARFPHRRRFFVLGSATDHDFRGVAAELCQPAAGVVCTGVPDNPRSLPPADLAPQVAPTGVRLETRPEPASALDLARAWATRDDLICVTGSLYLVGAVLAHIHGPEPI